MEVQQLGSANKTLVTNTASGPSWTMDARSAPATRVRSVSTGDDVARQLARHVVAAPDGPDGRHRRAGEQRCHPSSHAPAYEKGRIRARRRV
jgi:hypothetical protein